MAEQSTFQSIAPAVASFVPEIQKAKRVAGYTLAQIAELSGVPLTNINRFFAGDLSDPKLYNTAAICKLFNFSIDEHFGIAADADSRIKAVAEETKLLRAENDLLGRENQRLTFASQGLDKELAAAREQLEFCQKQVEFKEGQMIQKDKLLDERADFLRLKDGEIRRKTHAVRWLTGALTGCVLAIIYLLAR